MIPFLSFRGHANLLLWGGLFINYVGLALCAHGALYYLDGETRLVDVAETILGLGVIIFLVGLALTAIGIIMCIAHCIYTSRRDRPRNPDAL